jgi:hypothetical protein
MCRCRPSCRECRLSTAAGNDSARPLPLRTTFTVTLRSVSRALLASTADFPADFAALVVLTAPATRPAFAAWPEGSLRFATLHVLPM